MSERLVAWLHEQVNEDAQRIRLALDVVSDRWDWELIAQQLHACCDTVPNVGRAGQYLHRNADPSRALAEVEFKRKLLADYENSVTWSMDTLRDLASTVYKDRPGYAEAISGE